MLSAVSSFLPSALQFNHDSNHHQKSTPAQVDTGHNGESTHSPFPSPTSPTHNPVSSEDPKSIDQQETVDELGARKKRLPQMNETLIIVRPPPAKTNHPLNLQLQLVPPNANNNRVTSGSSTAQSITTRPSMESMNTPLERVPSIGAAGSIPSPSQSATAGPNRSVTDISLYSTYSTTSLTSNASTSSSIVSSASTRRIVPLYNLSAHNVLQNTVLDAGTDAKVAKFSKKGLEIIDLAFFELFEIWDGSISSNPILESSHQKRGSNIRPSTSTCEQDRSPVPSVLGLSTSTSNASSSSSLPGETPKAADFAEVPPREEKETQKKSSRRVFGKLFSRKKDPIGAIPTLLQVPLSPIIVAATPIRNSNEPSAFPLSPPPSAIDSSFLSPSLLPPVLDLQATLIRSEENSRRAASYVWVVRRWLKKQRGEGLKAMLSAAGDKMSNLPFPGLNLAHEEHPMDTEIRIEWERCTKRKTKGGHQPSLNTKRNSAYSGESNDVTRVASTTESNPRSGRSSEDRGSESTSRDHAAESDHDEDSDPEDSENPWTCSIALLRTQSFGQQSSNSHNISPTPSHLRTATSQNRLEVNSPQVRPLSMTSNLSAETQNDNTPVRTKVASLYPAPHHPKIVAQLKVPYPLPDLDVSHGIVHKRKGTGKRTEKDLARKDQPHMLSAEEIKDIICTTGFWLIVREGFGGVGKVKRKNDGWRIRA